MPLLRGRRNDDGGTKYQMREKMFAIGDDYLIETGDGQPAFKWKARPPQDAHCADARA